MIEIVLGVVVLISLLLIVFVIYNNKFHLAIIKIDKAEEDIEIYLERKQELLKRTKPIVKKELKLDEFLEHIENSYEDINNFETHNSLKIAYNELFKILDENEKLLKSEALISILEDLNNNEENIIGAIKFYNDTVVEFNQLVVSFPACVVAFLRRYKRLEFYNNEKREIFEILNDK